MRHITNILIALIVFSSLAFSENLAAPADPSQPATAVKIAGHWQDNGDNTATWIPESWQIVEQRPAAAPQRVVYVQQPAQQVIYVPERPAFRVTVGYPGGYGSSYSYGSSCGYHSGCSSSYHYSGGCSSLPPVTYHWQTYGHQQLR